MNITIRFLHIITSVDRDSERRLKDVLEGTPGRHTVVVGPASSRQALERIAAKVEIIQLPTLLAGASHRQDLAVIARVTRLARRRDFAVIHAHSPRSALIARAVAKASGIQQICESRRLDEPGEGVAGSRLLTRTNRLVDSFMVETEAAARRLIASGVPESRVAVIHTSAQINTCHPIERSARATMRESLGVDPKKKIVAFIGRIDRNNGADTILPILSEVPQDEIIQLLILGDGPMRPLLDDHGDQLIVHHLDPKTDPVQVIQAADAVLLPYNGDRLAGTLVQAAACDVPFATYQGEGVTELRDLGARGSLVPRGDVGALGAAVTELLASTEAPALDPGRHEGNRVWNTWDQTVIALKYRWRYEPDAMRPLTN